MGLQLPTKRLDISPSLDSEVASPKRSTPPSLSLLSSELRLESSLISPSLNSEVASPKCSTPPSLSLPSSELRLDSSLSAFLGSSWIACSTKSPINRSNLPGGTYPLVSLPTPLSGHLASEHSWTQAPKVNKIPRDFDFEADRSDA